MASKRHSGLGRGLDALFPDYTEETASAASNEVNESHQSTSENVSRGTIMVRLSRIEPNRKQPRKYFDEEALEELAQSIRQHGLLQPILVQDRDTYYEIIAGERRWRAARKAGLREVPVIVRSYTDQEIMELSLIENIQREDLNPIEEARAYQMLISEYHLKQEDVAQRVSKSRTAITNTMRLLKLDDKVQDMVISGELSMGQARALLGIDEKEQQRSLAQKIAEQKMSVREVENYVKQFKKQKSTSSTSKKKQKDEKDEQLELIYRDLENRLKEALHTRVSISSGNGKAGRLEIDFYSSDDLEKIADLLIGR